jgi:hypothetical protein
MSKFVLGHTILLVGMGAGHKVGDANSMKKELRRSYSAQQSIDIATIFWLNIHSIRHWNSLKNWNTSDLR